MHFRQPESTAESGYSQPSRLWTTRPIEGERLGPGFPTTTGRDLEDDDERLAGSSRRLLLTVDGMTLRRYARDDA